MNIKVLAALVFVVGCSCAVPLESTPDNSTIPVSDVLMPAEDTTDKPVKRDEESAKLNETTTTEAPLVGSNTTLPVHGKHPTVRAAVQKMNMSMSMRSTVTEAKNDTHHEMLDNKKSVNTTEAPIKKRAIASLTKKNDAVIKKGDKESLSTENHLVEEAKFNTTIPAQNDTALVEALLKHGLLDNKTVSENGTKSELLKKVAMREVSGNATLLPHNSTTVEVNKTAHAEHKEHTRHTEAEDCDDARHSDQTVLRSVKPENNSTVSKNETSSTPKPTEKARRRRGAYESSAPSQVRLAVRNKAVARSSYEAPAAPPARSSSYEAPAAAPARSSSYEAPAAPPAPSSYEAPAAAPVRSSYKAPAVRTAVRSSYSRAAPAASPAPSSYEAPAAPARSSSYEAPAAPPAPSSYEAPAAAPVRSSYKAPAVRSAVRSSYSRAISSSYDAPATAPARSSSYEAPAASPAPSYEAPAAPARSSSYEAPAAPARSSSYEAPAAPARSSSYEAPAAPPAPSSYEAPAAAPVRSSYQGPAVRTAVRSSYQAPAARSSSY